MKKQIIIPLAIFIFLIIALSTAAPVLGETARELNEKGYELYKEGDYVGALGYFREAIKADPTYALPHYNLACVLGIFRKMGGEMVCEHDAFKETILDYLEESIRLDPKRLDRAKGDADLDPIKDTIRYQVLLGLSPTNPEDIEEFLVQVTWYGPAPGAFGPMSGIDFRDDGSMTLWVLEVDDDVRKIEYPGTFIVEGGRVSIWLNDDYNGLYRLEGGLNSDGVLNLPGLPGPFTDDPHDCEA